MRIRDQPEAEDQPVTLMPLIDIVFLLLIFFLVATQIAQEEINREVKLAQSVSTEPLTSDEKQLFINVLEDGSIQVGSDDTTIGELTGIVRGEVQHRGVTKVIIRADELVPFGTPARVLDAVTEAGLNRADIALIRRELAGG